MNEGSFSRAAFQAHLDQHRLIGSRCKQDGQVFLPPRALCPNDFQSELEWVEFSGQGKLAAFSIIHIGPGAMVQAGYDRQNPYCAAIVELEEGPRVSAQLLEVDVHHPEKIQIGMPVQAAFVEREQGGQKLTLLAFRPA